MAVTPGEGKVDFEAVFRILNEAGFSGPCMVETLGGETLEEINAAARQTVAFLKDILNAF